MNDEKEENVDHWHSMDLFPEDAVSPKPNPISSVVPMSVDEVSATDEPELESVPERDPEPVPVLDISSVAPSSPSEHSEEEDDEPIDPETLRQMAGILRKQRHNGITHQQAMELLCNNKELLEQFKNMKTWH